MTLALLLATELLIGPARDPSAAAAPTTFVTSTTGEFCTTKTKAFAKSQLAVTLPAVSPAANAAIVTVTLGSPKECVATDFSGGSVGLLSSRSRTPVALGSLDALVGAYSFTAIVPLAQQPQGLALAFEAKVGVPYGTSGLGFNSGYTSTLTAVLVNCSASLKNCKIVS